MLTSLVCAVGILEPFDFRTIEGDFICDFILALFVDPSSIDENMMKANPYFDISHATQLLEKQFRDNNMPMPETAQDAFIAAGQKSGKFDDDGVALVHIDHLLEMVHEEYVRAVQAREEELIAVFKYYDKVRTSTAIIVCVVGIILTCASNAEQRNHYH